MKVKVLSLLVLCLMCFTSISIAGNVTNVQQSMKICGDVDYPEVHITIDYIEQIDDLDIGSKPDFYFKLFVYKSSTMYHDPQIYESNVLDEPTTTNPNNWQIDKTYDFFAYNDEISIDIVLKESDPLIGDDDTADISAKKGDGPGDVDGKKFTIVYDLGEDEILPRYDGEAWIEDTDGYIILNGELDERGQMGPGEEDLKEDDTKMRIKITDDYAKLSTKPIIKNDEILENNNIIPKDENVVTFECILEGGLPPFEYYFYPMGSTQAIGPIRENSRTILKNHVYSKIDHGKCKPTFGIIDAYDLAKEEKDREYIIFEADPVFINQRPKAVLRKTGLQYDASFSSDADGNTIQYKFKINGEETTDWTNNPYYSSVGVRSIELKVRDSPLGGVYGEGLDTDWEETQTRSVCVSNNLLEKLSSIFEFFQNLGLV